MTSKVEVMTSIALNKENEANNTKVTQKHVVNEFVVRFANTNGTGSASANNMFAKAILRMGYSRKC